MANLVSYTLPERPFVADDNGDIVGMISKNGAIIYFPSSKADNGLTAFAGGGQSSAVQLTYHTSRVTTVGTAADSVKLPKAIAGRMVTVINAAAANSMNVYPSSGEVINIAAADAALAVAAGKTVTFHSAVNGTWSGNLSA
jgi:hypothetical protein